MLFSDPVWAFLGVISGLLIIWIYERYQQFLVFRRMGIPFPRPHIISGNSVAMRSGSDKPVHTHQRWLKEYGNLFGYFRGTTPVLVVKDLDLIKQIAIKDFSSFHDRSGFVLNRKPLSDTLVQLRGERWKSVRKILTPTFKTSKMKQLTNVMNKHVTAFCHKLDEMAKSGQEFDIYNNFQRLTLDVIGESALAMTVNCQNNENEKFFQAIKMVMKNTAGVFVRFAAYFPFLVRFITFCYSFSARASVMVDTVANLKTVIEQRRKNWGQGKTIDVLQLMLDAVGNNDKVDRFAKTSKNQADHQESELLTDEEIAANCWMFVLAGFETTATALVYVAHVLAVNPDIQEKLHMKIKKLIKDDKTPTYDDANNLQYLDQVINETLRIYPPVVLFMTRECTHDYDLNGITIPAGMKVEIPIYSIHHDPELWPDPEKFDPDRFSPENKAKIHPMAHIPFGAGPRNCIGMRFALLEAKLTLIRLIRDYRLVPSAKTKDPPDVTVPHATYTPKNGIYLKVEKRVK